MENGAVDETRTRDLHLGKVALYQLSYYRTLSMKIGADEETRTLTSETLEPKSSASANSATPAQSDKALSNHTLRQSTRYIISQQQCFVKYFFPFFINYFY